MTGSIFLETSQLSVNERDGTVFVPVLRTGDLSGAVTIDFGTNADTAASGLDFLENDGRVTMAAGESRLSIPVSIVDDALSEATETFNLSLEVVSSGTLLAPRTARIDILDDENPVTEPPEPALVSDYNLGQRPVVSGLSQPIAFEFSPQNPGRVYVAEKGGVIKVYDTGTGADVATFVDLSFKVNEVLDRGLMDIALHPNFPQQPYVYAFYVVDPPDSVGQSGNAGLDGAGNRFAHLVRFTADAATNFTTAVPGSETILIGGAGRSLADISGGGAIDSTIAENVGLRASDFDPVTGAFRQDYIKVDSLSHAGGALEFGADGALYVSLGDGASYNLVDPRAVSVLDVNSLAGKILRVDPLTGDGLPGNPFVQPGASLDLNQSKVWQLGLRNPFAITFDDNGRLFISETGWFSQEEINRGAAGANFGWPYFEGGDDGVLLRTPGYRDLPGAQAFYAAVGSGQIAITPAFRSFSHADADPGFQVQAIVGASSTYDGLAYPAVFANDYFFTDISQGEIYSVDTLDRRDVKYLATLPTGFGPAQMEQGPDDLVYYADLITGTLGRFVITPKGAASTAPVANPDFFSVTSTGQLVIHGSTLRNVGPLANDTDANNDLLTVVAVNGAPIANGADVRGSNGGTFKVWFDGGFHFLPGTDFAALAAGQTAASSVNYTISDGNGGLASATATVTITGPNARASDNVDPIARNDAYTVSESGQLVIHGTVRHNTGPLANDSDADGDLLTIVAVNGAPIANGADVRGSNGGTFKVWFDGGFHFLPGTEFIALNAGQTAASSVEYTISDGRGGIASATATVTVTGEGGNAPPTDIRLSSNTIRELASNGAAVGTLAATDPDGPSLSWQLIDDAGGRFVLTSGNTVAVADGLKLDFEQAPFHDIRTRVSDGAGGTAEASLRINISNVDPEVVTTGNAPYTLVGGALADEITGGAGADTFTGGGGGDTLRGGGGNDVFLASERDGDDFYAGDSGIDTYSLAATSAGATVSLSAGTARSAATGSDSLSSIENVIGGSGDDVISASSVLNTLTGGSGNDTFRFTTIERAGIGANRDRITDYAAGDKIDVSGIDARDGGSTNQAFAFAGRIFAVSGGVGQLGRGEIGYRFETDARGAVHTIVEGNVDGSRAADFQIDLLGQHALSASDFLL